MRLKVIGGGNMGTAVVKAAIAKGVFLKENITIFERLDERAQFLRNELGCEVKVKPEIEGHDVLMVAVKPQNYEEALLSLRGSARESNLIISIMAGISTDALKKFLSPAQVIRVMPNTPASIGAGMSVYYGDHSVTDDSFGITARLLDACGKSIKVNSEDMIDASTAISGSGPAYVFYLAEQIAKTAVGLGFTEEQAELLSRQTTFGAAKLLDSSGETAAQLRKAVTSPGGTTAAAIDTLNASNCDGTINQALKNAYLRAKELGKE